MSQDIHIPSARSGQILRLGYHDRANLLPLLYPFKAGWIGPESPWHLQIVNNTPAALLASLLTGDLDAAFVTPAAAQLHGGKIAPLGGWGLAGTGTSETALLLAPQRLDLIEGRDVAISPEAAGSTAEHMFRTIL